MACSIAGLWRVRGAGDFSALFRVGDGVASYESPKPLRLRVHLVSAEPSKTAYHGWGFGGTVLRPVLPKRDMKLQIIDSFTLDGECEFWYLTVVPWFNSDN